MKPGLIDGQPCQWQVGRAVEEPGPERAGGDSEGFEAAIDHNVLQGSAPGQGKGEACRGFRSWPNRRRSSIGDGVLSSDGFIRRLEPPAQLRVGVEDLSSSTVVSLSRNGFYHMPIPPTLADALSIALRACPNRPPGWLQSVLPRLVIAQGPDSYRVCGLPRRPSSSSLIFPAPTPGWLPQPQNGND